MICSLRAWRVVSTIWAQGLNFFVLLCRFGGSRYRGRSVTARSNADTVSRQRLVALLTGTLPMLTQPPPWPAQRKTVRAIKMVYVT